MTSKFIKIESVLSIIVLRCEGLFAHLRKYAAERENKAVSIEFYECSDLQ